MFEMGSQKCKGNFNLTNRANIQIYQASVRFLSILLVGRALELSFDTIHLITFSYGPEHVYIDTF